MPTYDPKAVVVTLVHPTLGAKVVDGLAKGHFLTVERYEDAMKLYVGADGEFSRAKSNNLSGHADLILSQESATLDFLNQVATLDETMDNGIMTLNIADTRGNYLASSAACWIKKRPSSDFEEDIKERTWILDCGSLIIQDGGDDQ